MASVMNSMILFLLSKPVRLQYHLRNSMRNFSLLKPRNATTFPSPNQFLRPLTQHRNSRSHPSFHSRHSGSPRTPMSHHNGPSLQPSNGDCSSPRPYLGWCQICVPTHQAPTIHQSRQHQGLQTGAQLLQGQTKDVASPKSSPLLALSSVKTT
ncbi:hypothetical protein AAG906_012840 [Vitis piasezkii]